MSARKTSIDAYRNLVENGKLAEANRKVYKHLWYYGPTTQKKTERFLGDTTYTMRPRFAQLEKMGLIESCGTIICDETGVKNMLWDVTERIEPKVIEKEKKVKDKKQELINMLEKLDLTTSDMFIKKDLHDIISYVNKNF